jgi:transposase-like protein
MENGKKLKGGEAVREQIKKLTQQTYQEALEAELEEYLGYPKNQRSDNGNTRNGHSTKTVHTGTGDIELQVPRDRKAEFDPKLIKKRQTVLEDLQDKIIGMYAKGMTTRDIQDFIQDMYGMQMSASLVSRLTDRIMPRLEEWQSRPLQNVYVIVWLDCIFYRVRQAGRVINKAVYVLIGLGTDGRKELLGFWVNPTESSSFWLGVLNDLKSRGVKDVFIFSVDGLAGLAEAIRAAYPRAEVQRCVVHQIRNALKYVSWKEKKELVKDMKEIYNAATIEAAAVAMDAFEAKWGKKYPHVIKSWRTNWDDLMTYFRYPLELRKLVYTTNVIESVNSKFRKVTDARRVFPTDEAILKTLFMAALELEKKWTLSMRDWPIVYGQLVILFEDRLS